MGHRIIQVIYTCSLCDKTPEDGGKLWHMNDEVWCEACCDKQENESEEHLEHIMGDVKGQLSSL